MFHVRGVLVRRARSLTLEGSNDLDNRPMLAINDRLGYTPTVVIESYGKSLRGR